MKLLRLLAFFSMILAFLVVMLGAYTRLTHAGLGCPDWPGCYGHMTVPTQVQDIQKMFPTQPLETRKAWTEMVHRYLAGSLAVLIVIINGLSWINRRKGAPILLATALLGLVVFQAALGMWTVTLKLLPIVVMGHLLGGMLIFGGLVYFNFRLRTTPTTYNIWIYLGMFIVLLQIALGGWVSSNYAGLACVGFPQCNGQWLPAFTWEHSYQLWQNTGLNYQGGLLDPASRVTIQMVHRIGALLTMIYLGCLTIGLLHKQYQTKMKRHSMIIFLCLMFQVVLGIINVVYMLPLWAAVAHNGMAALLFASVITLHFTANAGGRHDRCG